MNCPLRTAFRGRTPVLLAATLLALGVAACSEGIAPTPDPVVILTTELPPARSGEPYSFTLQAQAPGAVTWRLASGQLPAGITLSPNGVLSGTPQAVGVTSFVVEASSNGSGTTLTLSLTVAAPNTAQLTVLGHGPVTARYSAELAVAEPWAYTTTWSNRGGNPGNALKIWNVTGPVPMLHDSVIMPFATTLGDVQISDDGALLVVATEGFPEGSLVIFDRSNPVAPRQLARHHTENTRNGVHTVKLGRVNGILYAFLSVNPVTSRLVILDLSNPAAPREVHVQPMGNPFIHDVFVRDGWLFTALWHDGMVIWDIGAETGSPAAPRRVGQVRTVNGRVHNIWWFHNPAAPGKRYVFVGDEGPTVLGASSSGDIHVVDVTDMANPREVAYYTVAGAGTHNFSMDEQNGILYAAYYNGGVRALDVRGDLGSCTAAQRAPDGRCNLGLMGREIGVGLVSVPGTTARAIWGVAWVGAHVYATDMFTGLYKLSALR
jgi:hypothetical protein